MRYILAILLLCAGAANASIYHYRYTGNAMPLTADGDRDFRVQSLGESPAPTPSINGPYVLDVRINAAHLPGGVLGDFRQYWGIAEASGPLLFVEPSVYTPITCCTDVFEANQWFNDWHMKMKSVSFKFKGTDIVDWRVAVDGQYIDTQGAVIDSKTGDRFSIFNYDYTTWENSAPGSWELVNVSEVPIPASAVFLIGALGMLFRFARRRTVTCP